MTRDVVVGLGSSLGDRRLALRAALRALDALPGTEVVAVSRLWASRALGPARRPFLNAAARLRTDLAPRRLLRACQAIERRLGRRPAVRWGDRVVDLDLLLFGSLRRRGRDLRLPHPELLRRSFALLPAREVAPELVHPVAGRPLAALPLPPGPPCWPVGVLDGAPMAVAGGQRGRYMPATLAGRRTGAWNGPPGSRREPSPPPRSRTMKIFLDTANLDQIREAHSWGIIDGVTTNPSLIAREGGDFVETIHRICEIVQGPVSAETVSQNAEGMIEEGRLLARISEHVVVKVPLSIEGLKATRVLSDEGIDVNVTLCFQAAQALLAAKAGAAYISPFLGRLDDIAHEGVGLIEQIVGIYGNYPELGTEVLAASIRHPLHVLQVAMAGADVATIPFKVLAKLVEHPLTDIGNERFLADWATVPDTDVAGQVRRWLAAREEGR